jgi:hypothetical protein
MTMKMKFLTAVLLLSVIVLPAQAQENIQLSGFMRNYTGVLTGQENEFSILQNTFDFNLETRGSRMALKVNPYLYHYFDRDLELGLREAYLDLYFNNFDLRVGKQQIIYGKAEGVFITDVVSPKDLREFLLPEFDEIRMGVTAAKLNYYRGNNTFELVWVPVFTPTNMPEEGSIWRPAMPFPVAPVFDLSTKEVKPKLENSELFFRYSAMTPGIDFEFVGGYFFDDDPINHITRQIDPETMQLTGLIARPEHHRLAMGGGSFSTQLGPFLLRGEAAYYNGKYFQTSSTMASDGTIEKDYLHYMAGLDYNLKGVILTAQFIQEYILDYEDGIMNEEFENTMTFLAKKDFFRERLWIELFSYLGLNRGDALIRPKATYSFADGFDIQFGANIFLGNEGRFGQFNQNDMIFTKLRYSF